MDGMYCKLASVLQVGMKKLCFFTINNVIYQSFYPWRLTVENKDNQSRQSQNISTFDSCANKFGVYFTEVGKRRTSTAYFSNLKDILEALLLA